jgi:recombinational DNA repair ATPase RecF
MCIERVIVKNYRTPDFLDLAIRPHLNIIVGDNESGKSTLLEAINLALKCQINRRSANAELHPYLFSATCVDDFLTKGDCDGIKLPVDEVIDGSDAKGVAVCRSLNHRCARRGFGDGNFH